MQNDALVARLKEQAVALKRSSEELALLAHYLPKHGATLRRLSDTLLNASEFIHSILAHVARDPKAA